MAVIESKSPMNDINFGEQSGKLSSLPKSAREIYNLLSTNGALKPREITSFTSLSNRTIRYGLKILVDSGFCRRVPDLQDLRTHFYAIN